MLLFLLAAVSTYQAAEANLSPLHSVRGIATNQSLGYYEVTGGSPWPGSKHKLFLVEKMDFSLVDQARAAKVIGSANRFHDWLGSGDLGVMSLTRTGSNGYSEGLYLWDGEVPNDSVSRAEYMRELTPVEVTLLKASHFGVSPFTRIPSDPLGYKRM